MSKRVMAGMAAALFLAIISTGAAQQMERPGSRYKIQNGDVIDLNFAFVQEFNQTVTVQPDGFINLRGIGEMQAAGITVPDLKKTLEDRYTAILKDPVISIELKDFQKPYFIAMGEVGKPGKYDLRADTKLSEAVAIAGWLSKDAKHSQVLLLRKATNDQVEVKQIDLKKLLKGENLSEDVRLEPGDTVVVPQNRISKIKPFVPLPYIRMMIPGL